MATKTVTLTGAELCVDELGGLNTLIVNNTDAPLYASAKAGITPYADGVIEIKAGASRGLPDTNGTVYLLGNGGRAELTGTSASVNFNVPSSSSEGGGGITRDEVNDIVTDKIAEVVANAPEDLDTLKEISDWIAGHEDSAAAMNSSIKANAADISDIQTEQQTQNSDITTLQTEMEEKANISNVNNLNLLDNSDFKINQRGQSEYTTSSAVYDLYTADRWSLSRLMSKKTFGSMHISENSITLTSGGDNYDCYLRQKIEKSDLLTNQIVTVSFYVEDIAGTWSTSQYGIDKTKQVVKGYNTFTFEWSENPIDNIHAIQLYNTTGEGSYLTIEKWMKLELGDKATPFVPPHPALELLKCQRYYQRLGGVIYYCIGSGTITNSNTAMILCPLLTPMLNSKKTVNIDGTLRIAVKEHVGNSAIACTGFSSGATVSQNSVVLPLNIEPVDAELVGCGCIAQCRDNETYVEISADL